MNYNERKFIVYVLRSFMSHLVFYDGQCGLCDRIVQFLLKTDKRQQFVFAPLQGSTAAVVLKDLPSEMKQVDSLILVENFQTPQEKFYVLGKGAFRICWLLGGAWSLLGWISFLPGWLYNWGYRLVARNRQRFFKQDRCLLPDPSAKHRFLP
jgi:predicted DCC family thiol-disulfide oxidoreductase YuxK